jgi:hypothetical protein
MMESANGQIPNQPTLVFLPPGTQKVIHCLTSRAIPEGLNSNRMRLLASEAHFPVSSL